MKINFMQSEGDALMLEVDLGVYSSSALLKVAYRFTDRCYLHLQKKSESVVEVRFRTKSATEKVVQIAGEFFNEMLDQSLREIISKESEAERNLILAHALSKTCLVQPEETTA